MIDSAKKDRFLSPQPTPPRSPTGLRDLLPLDVIQKQWVEDRLGQVFQSWGYQRIITPTLEQLDDLTAGDFIHPRSILQLRDAEGTMLGLRPELTGPVVRAAATRLAGSPMPLRLYYQASAFQNTQRDQEFYQSGVELIGAGDWLAEAEILLVLADGLQALQVPPWKLILGDVSLTQSLLSLLSPTAQPIARRAIARLDRVELEIAPIPEADRHMGLQILEMRGRSDQVFRQLRQLSLPAPQRDRARQLHQLCQMLQDEGVDLVVDFSLLQPFAYYTGIVFKVVCEREVIGSGGRYDQLFSLYSPSRIQQPGIGFTLLLEELQRVLGAAGQLPSQLRSIQRLLVPSEESAFSAALSLARQWRQVSPLSHIELELLNRSHEEILEYAQRRQIQEVVWIQVDGTYHTTVLPDP